MEFTKEEKMKLDARLKERDALLELDRDLAEKIKLGTKVRCWDFEPMKEREDRYVEGMVIDIKEGVMKVSVDYDSTEMRRIQIHTGLPGSMIFDFPGRVQII